MDQIKNRQHHQIQRQEKTLEKNKIEHLSYFEMQEIIKHFFNHIKKETLFAKLA